MMRLGAVSDHRSLSSLALKLRPSGRALTDCNRVPILNAASDVAVECAVRAL